MDLETSRTIEMLRADLRRVESSLRAEIGALRMEIRGEFREGAADISKQLDALSAKVDAIRDPVGQA